MKKVLLVGVCTSAMFGGVVHAQAVSNNFSRDRSVSVMERQHPEYTPLGVNLGAFRLSPTVTVSAGYNDNVYYTATNEKSSAILQVAPRISGSTTWSRHAASFSLGALSEKYGSASSEDVTSWNASLGGRVDISAASAVTGDFSHVRTYESRSGYQAIAAAAERTPIDIDRANLGVALVGNRLRFMGSVTATKESYGDVPSVNGGIILQGYRDLTNTTLTGRVDYAISPAISVFVSAASNQRRYETSSQNDSDGQVLSVGSSFDISALARGEVQVGTFTQDYKDGTVGKQSNAYINALVDYFPSPLTTVSGNVNRSYADYPAPAGTTRTALNTSYGISVDHELLRNIVISAGIQGMKYEFKGIDRDDTSHAIKLGGRYLVNRRVSINVDYTYRKYESEGTAAFRNFTDNSLLASVALAY